MLRAVGSCSHPPHPALGAEGRKRTLPHGGHTYRVADGVAAARKHGESREGSESQGRRQTGPDGALPGGGGSRTRTPAPWEQTGRSLSSPSPGRTRSPGPPLPPKWPECNAAEGDCLGFQEASRTCGGPVSLLDFTVSSMTFLPREKPPDQGSKKHLNQRLFWIWAPGLRARRVSLGSRSRWDRIPHPRRVLPGPWESQVPAGETQPGGSAPLLRRKTGKQDGWGPHDTPHERGACRASRGEGQDGQPGAGGRGTATGPREARASPGR